MNVGVPSRQVVQILNHGGSFDDDKNLVAGGPKVFDGGDIEAGSWSVSTAMGLMNGIPTVDELIKRLVSDAGDPIAGLLATVMRGKVAGRPAATTPLPIQSDNRCHQYPRTANSPATKTGPGHPSRRSTPGISPPTPARPSRHIDNSAHP
jgi:hypothetical protein